MTYTCLIVTLPEHLLDEVSGLLVLAGAAGLEVQDHATANAPEGDECRVIAWFETAGDASNAAAHLGQSHGDRLKSRLDHVEDPGWREAWRAHFRPMRFGQRLFVAPFDVDPSDEELKNAPDPPVILRLVPSGAFGTGTHESTALMLELLGELVTPGARVLDVGTGSGILAMAAVGLGASSARGLDIDAEAIGVAQENAAKNALRRCSFETTALADVDERFDLVLANLSAPVLIAEKATLASRVTPGGALLWSGLLADDLVEVGAPPGLCLELDRRRNEWAAQAFRRGRGLSR